MAKTDLLKEAIADARAVRETALANAKIALEEAFTPRLQSMLSAKLSEDEEMDEMAEEPTETNGKGMDAAAGAPVDETEEKDMEEDMEMEEPAMEDPAPAMEGEGEDKMDEEKEDMEEDLELEAIIRELEEDMEDDKETNEVSDSSDIGTGDNKLDYADGDDQDDPGKGKLTAEGEKKDMDEEKEDMDEDISLDEIIEALREDEDDKMDETKDDKMDETKDDKMDETEDKKDLEEAYKVIRFLKSKINEVNLLNAKLLFSNKLFRNHTMNENQKLKVIENFDRAQSLREVKLVFATLSESFNFGGKTKRTIKESYASKSTRSTAPSKKVISEGSDLSARWKKLANL